MNEKELAQKILDVAQNAFRESALQWTAGGSGGAICQGLEDVIKICLAELGITEEQIPNLPGSNTEIERTKTRVRINGQVNMTVAHPKCNDLMLIGKLQRTIKDAQDVILEA